MMTSSRPWLPANAVRDTRLTEALSATLRSWSQRWFLDGRATPIRWSAMKSRTTLAGDTLCWGNAESGLVTALHVNGHSVIAGAMLGVDCGAHKSKANDHLILRELASVCARDLMKQTCKLFGFTPSLEETRGREIEVAIRFSIGIGKASQLLDIFMDEKTAIAARRSLLARASAPAPAAGARQAAIHRQSIRLGAMVGVAHLDLGQLRALGIGDILVLDRGPEDDLVLAINGRPSERACQIVEDAGALKLRLNSLHPGG